MLKRNPVKFLIATAALAGASTLALAMDVSRDLYWHAKEPDGLVRAAPEGMARPSRAASKPRAPDVPVAMTRSETARAAPRTDSQARETRPETPSGYDLVDNYNP